MCTIFQSHIELADRGQRVAMVGVTLTKNIYNVGISNVWYGTPDGGQMMWPGNWHVVASCDHAAELLTHWCLTHLRTRCEKLEVYVSPTLTHVTQEFPRLESNPGTAFASFLHYFLFPKSAHLPCLTAFAYFISLFPLLQSSWWGNEYYLNYLCNVVSKYIFIFIFNRGEHWVQLNKKF